jgi:O-methyltransferase
MTPTDILNKYSLISDQVTKEEVGLILNYLQISLDNSKGNVIEMGCYAGTTSLMIQRLLKSNDHADVEFHVYDSFEGLPDKNKQDQSPVGIQFQKGQLKFSKKQYIENFKKNELKIPKIHKDWFSELNNNDIPNNIIFAFLDGDYYDSIAQSLRLIEKKMSPDGYILIDDYQSEQLPGAKKATDEWLSSNNHFYLYKVEDSIAIIRGGREDY